MFALPEVDSCCCCCSLRTGTKLFGFFSLCQCILSIVISTLEMAEVSIHYPEKYKDVSYVTSLDILIQVIQGAASLFMLLAAFQESRKLLPPCILTTIAVIVLNAVLPSSLRRGIVVLHYEQFWALLKVVTLVADLYGLLVIYSYYRSLTSLDCQAI